MYSTGYENIKITEANLNFEGLTILLDGMLKDLVSEDQKNLIVKWAQHLPSLPLSPAVSTGYYNNVPEVRRKALVADKVVDVTKIGAGATSTSIKSISVAELTEFLSTMSEGSSIILQKTNSGVTDTLAIGTDNVTINGGKNTLSNAITITGNGVTLTDATITNGSITDTSNSAHMLVISGDDTVVKNCTIADANTKMRTAIIMNSHTATFENCTFSGNAQIYNSFEASQSVDGKIKSIAFKNCSFSSDACTNNNVSMYQFEDGATVLFENCKFVCAKNNNAVRLSNYSNAKVNIIFNNCEYSTVEAGEWSGLLLLQNIHSGEDTEDFGLFTINFKNLHKPNGNKYTSNGTGINRIWYTYNSETVPNVNFS
jgi:hypothetical protein